MNDKIKRAFDGIHAEEQLKRNTFTFLQSKIQQRPQKSHWAGFRRLAAALVCFLILTFTSIFSYSIYFVEAMYVDVDINPSIELAVNRFDRIISVYAYNTDGEELLVQLELLHKPYDSAVTLLTEAAIDKGFLLDGGLVSVTLQSSNRASEDAILEILQTNIAFAAQVHHASVQVEVFLVADDIRASAHVQNISPAKYLAILELQAVDPTATVDGCRNHTIGEIRERAQEHSSGHHGETDNYTAPSDNEEAQGEDNSVAPAEDFGSHGAGHHGHGHKQKH